MTTTVPKRTNRLAFLLPGVLAAGTALLVCLAPEVPNDPVTQSDIAALTSVHDCSRFGALPGSPHWSAAVSNDDPDSPDDDDDDSPDRDGPDAVPAAAPAGAAIGADSTPVAHADVVASHVADFDVQLQRGPPASSPWDRCGLDSRRTADARYWSSTLNDNSPDPSDDDDDDDDDDDGPDGLIGAAPACIDSAHRCPSDFSDALSNPIHRASETRSLRAPPR